MNVASASNDAMFGRWVVLALTAGIFLGWAVTEPVDRGGAVASPTEAAKASVATPVASPVTSTGTNRPAAGGVVSR